MIATVVIAAAAAASLAGDAGLERVTARAKACIQSNAAEVERAETSLSAAADFLIDDVCAIPVSVLDTYRGSLQALAIGRKSEMYGDFMGDVNLHGAPAANAEALARYKAREAKRRDAYARASISEETGEILLPAGSEELSGFIITAGPGRRFAQPDLRATAAKALLDARRARQGR